MLSADTIVWFAGRIFAKPRSTAEAADFLRTLSGNTHTVFTGVALRRENGELMTAVAESAVTFRVLDETALLDYVRRVKPLDRAGAYDIDESGDLLVESYEGEYENIMGLPVAPIREWLNVEG